MANSDANGSEWNFGKFESVDPFFSRPSLDNADDWGEFVMTPVGSNSTSHPFVQTAVSSLTNSIGFGDSSNLSMNVPSKDGNANRWEKIKGAIPLSIFGLEEEEEMEKGETNGFPADKNGGVEKDVRSEIDHGASNMRLTPNGLDKLLETSAFTPDPVKGNGLSELEVLKNGDGDDYSVKFSGLPNNKLDWNPLGLNDKANAFESLPDLGGLVNGDNSHNVAVGDSDEDAWEFKNADMKSEATNGNFMSNELNSQNEGQIYFGGIDSMWPSVATDFGESKLVDTNKSADWFSDDFARNQRINDGNDLWQFHSLSPQEVANNSSLEDKSPKTASIVSTVIPSLITDTLETTEMKVDNSNASLRNKSTEANGEEEEEWSFHAAKVDDNFEQPSWNTLNSNNSGVEEENTSSINGVDDDLWAQDFWDFKDSAKGNSSTSQGNKIPANANLASLSDCEVSQLPSSHSPVWNFTLDISPSAETVNTISPSFFLNNDESNAFEDNSWDFVGTEASKMKSEGSSADTSRNISDMIPRANGENYSFFSPNSNSHLSEENSWGFVGVDASGKKSKVSSPETGQITSDAMQHNNGKVDSLFSPNDEDHAALENSWAFVGAQASENKAEAISTPSKAQALPLSIFGEEETEFDTPVLDDLTKSITGSNINHTNVTIEDIVSSLYNDMDDNTPTNRINVDTENGPDFPAEVDTVNHSIEKQESDDDAWEFQEPALYKEDDDHDEYVDVFEQLRAKLILAAQFYHENHKTERSDVLDGIVKKFDDSNVGIQGIDASQESSIPNAQNLSELTSEIVTILKDPKLELLESAYSLTTALSTDGKGFQRSSALLNNVTSILRILKLATKENRQKFVVVWSKLLVACLHELSHGASIWKDLIKINAHKKILLESRGKDLVTSLREIYRVVEIVKVSSQIYKAWVCTLPEDSSKVPSLIDQSVSLWASSGLQEAYESLESASSAGLETNTETVFDSGSPICQLSLLPESAFPDVQMVEWNGKSYLVNVANVWANLVHCQPPMLPTLLFTSSTA